MSFTASLSTLSAAQTVTLLIGSLSIIYGVQGVFAPSAFATQFGFPSQTSASQLKGSPKPRRDPFVVATGGRTAALGLALVIFALEDQLNAAGIVLACCSLSGLSDAVSCYTAGNIGATVQHGIGTITLGTLGWWLKSQS